MPFSEILLGLLKMVLLWGGIIGTVVAIIIYSNSGDTSKVHDRAHKWAMIFLVVTILGLIVQFILDYYFVMKLIF